MGRILDPRHQKVYPRKVELVFPIAGRGRSEIRQIVMSAIVSAFHVILALV